jgi:CheY-like chemotaxis protein
MSRRLLGADIEIEFRPADDQAVIYADRGQIEQVLMNLCVNARDAMPRGGRLKVEIAPLGTLASDGDTSVIGPLPSGPCVRISVSDTGVGISPENLPHIFEPFFTTKPKNKGSGLGLSVVYGIIQQHGGNLRIDSKVGIGTTFHVYLPASPGTATAQRVTRELPVKRGSGTILVAEDEEAVRLLATRILQKAGYTVLAARDGEEAVSLFRENNENVDLLLMDVIMPRLSGPEAVKQIRELDPEIPALYASGYGGEFLRADGRLDIEGEVLQKPYQPSELLDRISGYLSNTRR